MINHLSDEKYYITNYIILLRGDIRSYSVDYLFSRVFLMSNTVITSQTKKAVRPITNRVGISGNNTSPVSDHKDTITKVAVVPRQMRKIASRMRLNVFMTFSISRNKRSD